jgi:hypothetical protein
LGNFQQGLVIAVADGMNLEWAVCFVSYLLGG